MMALLKELFPLNRSLTGDGVRETLRILKREIGNLDIHNVASGTPVFDWTVPDEWNIDEAYLITPTGEKICDYHTNNLHLVGYSAPVETTVTLDELQSHLRSLPDMPEAIPYDTSYYKNDWGFCLSDKQRQRLPEGRYKVVINGRLAPGNLTYGELFIPSTENCQHDVFFSTYVCHPSMANNELSGPVVSTFLAKWLLEKRCRRFNYRFVFAPETIGSLTYLSHNLEDLRNRVVAGFNLTCVGDDRCFSFVPTRKGGTLADDIALHVLNHHDPDFKAYTFLDRGSDERQYCAPGIDLPVATMCRSKYGTYPEYHTSLDNLDFVGEPGLSGSLLIHQRAIECLENNKIFRTTVLGEPKLDRRGLYPYSGLAKRSVELQRILDLLAYADGEASLLEIANNINAPMWELFSLCQILKDQKLIEAI